MRGQFSNIINIFFFQFLLLIGSIQGKFQPHGILGDCEDFLHHQSSQSVTFKIPSRGPNRLISLVSKQFRYDVPYVGQPFNLKCGGFWHAGKFHAFNSKQNGGIPLLLENKNLNLHGSKTGTTEQMNIRWTSKFHKQNRIKHIKPSSFSPIKQEHDDGSNQIHHNVANNNRSRGPQFQTLKIYGDSMGRHFHDSLVANHTLCRNMFKQYSLSYTWVYKMFNQTVDRYQGVHNYDNLDFNESRFLSDLRSDLTTPDMLNTKSIYVVNFGVHTIMTLPLSTMKELLRKFIEMVAGLRLKYGPGKSPLVIWKTTTFPYLERFKPKPSTQLRFLTKHVSLFLLVPQNAIS